jgi:transposase-like protein
MKKGYKISQEIKDQILKRVRDDGVTVVQAAQEHGVHESTIYGWLGKGAEAGSGAELLKLRREKKALLELVGEMTLKLSESQKKS